MAGTAIAKDDSWKVDWDIMELLQPFELTTSATPVEFKKWTDQLKAYFELSKLYKQSLLFQNVVVKKFMDKNLDMRMEWRTKGSNVPIFGTSKESYREKHPEEVGNSVEQITCYDL